MTRNILRISSGFALAAFALSAMPASAQVVTLASASAADYSDNSQLTTQNNGTGFAGAFGAGGSGGFFLGDSQTNGGVQYGGAPGVGIDSAGVPAGRSAFGIYSNGGNGYTVQRTLAVPLTVGSTLSLGFDNGYIDGGFQQVGIGTAGNNTLVEFGFQGGRSSYLFNFGESNLGFTDGGLNIAFTLTSATNYTLTATRLSDNAVASVNGSFAPGTSIDTLTFLNSNSTGGGQSHDFFVNNLSVTAPVAAPEPSQAVALTVGALTLGMLTLRARRRMQA